MSSSTVRPHGNPDRKPLTCPYGDPLWEGSVLVGWSPCGCHPGRGGHRTYQCIACLNRKWKTVCYYPPHRGGDGHPESFR